MGNSAKKAIAELAADSEFLRSIEGMDVDQAVGHATATARDRGYEVTPDEMVLEVRALEQLPDEVLDLVAGGVAPKVRTVSARLTGLGSQGPSAAPTQYPYPVHGGGSASTGTC